MNRLGRDRNGNIPEPKNIVVDFDGTIAEFDHWRGKYVYGNLVPGAKETLTLLHTQGYQIIVFTCRNWIEQGAIAEYLTANSIPFDQIICGKPIGLIYIDDRSTGRNGDWEQIRWDLGIGDYGD